MKKYKLYLFDFDGTLFDTIKNCQRVFIDAFGRIGIEINPDDVVTYTRRPIPHTYREIVPNYNEEDIEPFVKHIETLVNEGGADDATEIYDDSFETLLDLKVSNATLGIVTSNTIRHVNDLLKKFNLDNGFFDVIVGSEMIKEHKPDPECILTSLELLKEKFDKSDICYVGDSLNDILAAKAAGIDGILIDRNGEYLSHEGLKITTLKELL